jgi:hypothetical protein
MRKKLVVVLALAAITVVMSSCQLGQTMYASCNKAADGNPFGADSKRVLVCENSIWKPVMTLDEFVGILQKKNVTIAPVPLAPDGAMCWNITVADDPTPVISLSYNGQANTADNATAYDGTDCKTSTGSGTVVWANDEATATSLCAAVDPSLTFTAQANDALQTESLPATLWLCDTSAV